MSDDKKKEPVFLFKGQEIGRAAALAAAAHLVAEMQEIPPGSLAGEPAEEIGPAEILAGGCDGEQ